MNITSQIKNIISSSLVKMYIEYGTQYWIYAFIAIFTSIISTTLNQVPQIAFGLIIEIVDPTESESAIPYADILLSSSTNTRLFQIAFVLLVSIILSAIIGAISSYAWSYFALLFQQNLRVETYSAIQELHPKRFIQRSKGEYLSIVESDIQEMGYLPKVIASGIVSDVTSILTMGILLFALNWQLAILVFVAVPFMGYLASKFGDVMSKAYKKSREASATLTEQISSSINGVMTVRSYVAENQEIERVENATTEVFDAEIQAKKKGLIFSKLFTFITQFTSFFILIIGAYWVIIGPPLIFTEPLTAGELAIFYTNATLLLNPARSISTYVDSYTSGLASSDRIYELFNERDEDYEKYKDSESFDTISGDILYDNVLFTYDFEDEKSMNNNEKKDENNLEQDNFTLGPISCSIENGETVGIVGMSGSGKTTFIQLLMRFIDSDEGSICINNIDITNRDPRSLRDHIGYVEQDPYIFNDTIKSNITYGYANASDKEIEAAIKNAALENVIDDLEEGIETVVGDDGVRLSGGERQRVALARAIISDPEILVLDEATSHVDNITESKIQQSINEARKGRTTLIIAHRLSTVRQSDKLFVFDDGKIVENGSHDELIEIDDGLYNKLWSQHIGSK